MGSAAAGSKRRAGTRTGLGIAAPARPAPAPVGVCRPLVAPGALRPGPSGGDPRSAPEPVDQNASVATTGHPVPVAGVVTVCVAGPAATMTCDAARTCSDTRPWVFVQPWVLPK